MVLPKQDIAVGVQGDVVVFFAVKRKVKVDGFGSVSAGLAIGIKLLAIDYRENLHAVLDVIFLFDFPLIRRCSLRPDHLCAVRLVDGGRGQIDIEHLRIGEGNRSSNKKCGKAIFGERHIGLGTGCLYHHPIGIVDYRKVVDHTGAGIRSIFFVDEQEITSLLPGLDVTEQRRNIQAKLEGFVGFAAAAGHIFVATLVIEDGEVDDVFRFGSSRRNGHPGHHLQGVANIVRQLNFIGKLWLGIFFGFDHMHRSVPASALRQSAAQRAVEAPGIAGVAPGGSIITVGQLYAANFPVADVDYSIAVDVEMVGVLAVIIQVVSYRVVIAHHRHGMVGIGRHLYHYMLAPFRSS